MPDRLPRHRPLGWDQQRLEQRSGDRKTFYATPRWRALRRSFLARHPICADPFSIHQRTGEVVPATQVHHAVGRRARPELAFDAEHLEGLCHRCHSRITLGDHVR